MSYKDKYKADRKQEFQNAAFRRKVLSSFFGILLIVSVMTMMLGMASADYEDNFFVFLLAGCIGTVIAATGIHIMEGYDEDASI